VDLTPKPKDKFRLSKLPPRGRWSTPGQGEGPWLAVECTPDEEHPELVLFTTLENRSRDGQPLPARSGLPPAQHPGGVAGGAAPAGHGKTDYRALKAMLG